jgi:uncharacterized protein YidB (DUF937 family)
MSVQIDEMFSALLDKVGAPKEILGSVQRLVGEEGGLGGFVSKFTGAGHAEKAESWIAKGPNKPITGEEVVRTLGEAKVDEAARAAGISRTEAASKLAEAIPKVVDELTPEGKLPEGEPVKALAGRV